MCENNELINGLNELKINEREDELNDEKSDYESCEESIDQNISQNEIQTDDELTNQLELDLSEEELNQRKCDSIELKSEGNKLFKEGLYEKSIEFYSNAIHLCPTVYREERAVMFANRSAAEIHLNLTDNAIEDCNKAIELNPNYVKALLRRAQLYRNSSEKLDQCLEDYKKVIQLDPNCGEAIVAAQQLPIEINERNERMKAEMMNKLKDLGNLVLRPFGLSTDNFKLSQNSETGGYSVNFQNN